MVIPIGSVVTAATGVKKRSRGQGLFLVSVKRSRTIFKLVNSGQDINVLRMRIAHSVVKCVRSNGQGPICGAVKWSSNKNDGQNFLTQVAAVTTAPIGVTTPWGGGLNCVQGNDEAGGGGLIVSRGMMKEGTKKKCHGVLGVMPKLNVSGRSTVIGKINKSALQGSN